MSDTIIKMTGGVIRQQKNTILKNVNIEIRNGEFVYLIGKVGSGKSSFLKTLYAELPLEYGQAEVAGFQLKKLKKSQVPLLRRKCGIVFQDFKLLTDRNVYQNLEFVLRATGWKNKKAIRERIETVLAKVGMLDKQTQMPHQLSGGEQQRIVLARALLNAPPLILADEPTGNIDPETSYKLVELLKEICDTGKTILIATHQYDLIEKYPGRVLCCENGELFEKVAGTNVDSCECGEETIPLPEINEGIPEVDPATSPDACPAGSPTPEENAVREAEVSLVAAPDSEIEVKEETTVSAPSQDEPSLSGHAEKEEEDILSLIGKLDYPEVTAFDYELDHLPEIEAENEKKEPDTHEEQKEAKNTATPVNVPEKNGEKDEESPKNPPVMDLELID